MKDYICLFKVLCNNDDNENVEECGFCFANSFTEAVKYLEEELYKSDLIEIHHIELLDTCPILSKEVWEIIRKVLNEA
jgi:hypothetical protein